jgi:glucose/mannose transport system permease protein
MLRPAPAGNNIIVESGNLNNSALKSYAEVNLATLWSLPKGISFDSFLRAWNGDPLKGTQGLSSNFMNSLKLVIPSTIRSSLLGPLNGYVLSKWKFRGANITFPAILFGMFIPYQSILIPLVQTM